MASPRSLLPARRDDLVERAFARFASPTLLAALLAAAAVVVALSEPARRAGATFEAATDGGVAWRLYLALELYDPLHAWPFALLLVLALLSAVAFAVSRLLSALAALHPAPRLDDEAARGLRAVVRTDWSAGAEAATSRIARALRGRGFAPRVEEDGQVRYLFAERGRASRFGPPLAALGLALLLLGGLVRSLFGWEATVEVPEGGFVGAVPARTPTGESYRRALPYVARLDALDARAEGPGRARATRAAVSLYDPSGRPLPEHRGEDLAARAAGEGGVAFALAGAREIADGARATLAITDKVNGVRRELLAARSDPVDVGSGVTFTVLASTPRFGELGPAVQLRRAEAGRATEFWVFESRPEFDGQNRPDRFAVEFHGMRPSYAAILRVAREPGAPLLAAGAAILLAGAALASYRVHRRVWARAEAGRVVLAASSPRSPAATEMLLAGLREALSRPEREKGEEATA